MTYLEAKRALEHEIIGGRLRRSLAQAYRISAARKDLREAAERERQAAIVAWAELHPADLDRAIAQASTSDIETLLAQSELDRWPEA